MMKGFERLDRMAFRKEFIILPNGKRRGECMDVWQEEDFRALDSGKFKHAYLERPRGHSKTGDLGDEGVTDLIFAPPEAQLFGSAGDEDQADILFADIAGKYRRHPVLARLVTIGTRVITVKETRATYTRLTSNAPSNYGLRPYRVYVDEIAEMTKRDLWDALWTATGKMPDCGVRVISTAGWDRTSIAWEVRTLAEREADWYFKSRGPCASWISQAWRDQQERTLPPHVFARLHLCRWVDAVGAWLSHEQIAPIFRSLPSGTGVGACGLDIGISGDRTVIAYAEAVGDWVVVKHLLHFVPTKRTRVDLPEVEEAVETLARRYHCPIYADPYQAVGLSQRLQARGLRVVEYSFTTESRRALFGGLLELITANRLRCPPDETLERELLSLEVKQTAAGGWRVDHAPGRHDDAVVAVALAIAGLPLHRSAECPILLGGPRTVADERLAWKAGQPVIVSSEQRSIDRAAAIETGPGGARR